jgi:hypothetical protein
LSIAPLSSTSVSKGMLARRVPLLLLLVALDGCIAVPTRPDPGSGGSGGSGGSSGDMAIAPPPADAAVPHDLAVVTPHDLAVGTPPDLTPVIMTTPPDLLPPPGLNWPTGQVFPSFGPIGALDVIDLSGFAADRQTLAVTLAGLINRARPRIYCENNDGEGKTFWLDKIGAPTTAFTDPLALVAKYHGEVSGMVIYDDTMIDTVNLATVIAAQRNGIVASPALAATLAAAPYQLPVLVDLRSNHFANKLAVYQFEHDNWTTNATHRLIVGLNPTIAGALRDYAVATQAMMVWLDPRVPAEQQLLGSFLQLLAPNSPYLGWWIDEPTGVQAASTQGVPTYAADWSANLTVLGGTPRGSAVTPPTPAPPPLENKVYVAIFMSDGDNVQEDQHLIPLKWSDAKRGQVPISWTVDPALVDVAPIILRYFQQSASHNDVLVSGPSGLGYTYPAAWPANIFDSYAQVSSRYLAAAGLKVVTVWNNGVDLSSANGHSYASNAPGLVGMTIQDESQSLQLIDGTLPLLKLAVSYASTETDLENGIDPQLASWNGAAPLFVAVQGDMNMGTINPGTFYNVQEHYAGNSNVVFVRGDHFFRLLRAAQQPAAHKVLSGDFNGDGKTDSLFYYGGNGDWWMGLSDGSKLTWHNAGNVGSLGNLIDAKHAFYTGDFNGDGKSDVLIYSSDGNWRLGTSDGTNLTFTIINNSSGYGDLLDGAHRTFTGDFTGDGKADVLFYFKNDGHWWLGTSNGTGLSWAMVYNASGFGNLLDGGHVLYTGDFNGDGKRDVGFYYAGDGNWYLGLSDGATLTWHLAGNTNNFGNLIDPSRRIVQGDFNGDGKTDFLFYYNGDGHCYMGLSDGMNLTWHLASTVTSTSPLTDPSYRLFVGDFDGDHKSDLAYYNSDDGSWSIGASDGTNLTWHAAGSDATLGNLADTDHLLFGGDYDGDGKSDFLSYAAGDGNWRMGLSDGTKLNWHVAVNSSGFGDLTH